MTPEIKNIFCPLDLSVESEGTLKNAFAFARAFGAKLSICFCAPELSPATGAGARRELEDLIKGVIDHFVSSEGGGAKIDWESSFVGSESVAQGIVNEAECRRADLIMMHSRRCRRDAFCRDALACSNAAEEVWRTARCPVLVVDPRKSPEESSLMKRILVPYDFSDYSERALQNAVGFARAYGAALHLLHVIPETARDASELVWTDRAAVNYLYHQTNERLQKSLPPPPAAAAVAQKIPELVTRVRWGKPYREILAYAEDHDIDLIAMGARGADFGLSTLFGSNVDRVLRQAPCAVLVSRPLKPLCRNGA